MSPRPPNSGNLHTFGPSDCTNSKKRPRTGLCWAEAFKVKEEEEEISLERDLNMRHLRSLSLIIIKRPAFPAASHVKEIHTVIGGCHLFNAKSEQVKKTVDVLKEFNIQQLGVSHCTGMKASFAMMEEFGDRFYFNNAGTIKTIPAEERQ